MKQYIDTNVWNGPLILLYILSNKEYSDHSELALHTFRHTAFLVYATVVIVLNAPRYFLLFWGTFAKVKMYVTTDLDTLLGFLWCL